VILAAFAAGAVVGLTATLATVVRQGRELKRLRGRLAGDAQADPS
jgi:uncharacterized integral membrane protein